MEFLRTNLINTTTQISLTNNTTVVQNIFSRDPFYQYYTENLADDLTTGSITITFDATTNVSRLAMIDTNLKAFNIFYNGVTANTFALTQQATTVSQFTGNADSNVYLKFPTTAVSSITIDMKKTITANQEKVLGLFFISETLYSMGQIPNSSGFDPNLVPKQIVHTLSDGGQRVHNVRKKFSLSMELDYVPAADVSSLRSIFDLEASFQFAAFGTSTSWTNPVFFEAVWPGGFNFFKYSDEAVGAGFSGKINLKETPF